MANVIRILVEADDKASDKLNKVGKAGVAALAGVGVAAGAFAVSSTKAFVDFEKQMNEVYTLMPGISEQAMGKMEDQVKDFSKEFGTLPQDVIPSLYQALSAGVPPDNVFEFLETAQKAAIGGVTDLETAVDGISSVVNAYGEDVLSAADAADIMFTGVKLGKTTFEELSSSLAKVTPLASSLGIGFDEVVGSIAALTSVGFNTAEAVTGMRGALSELSKEGTKVNDFFTELTGTSFPDFITQGGTVEEAISLLAEGADASGTSLQDLFGAIEGGQAVMALAAGEVEKLGGVMDGMGERTGAATEAFETMDQGVGRNLDKLQANFAVLKLEVGEALLPVLVAVTDYLLENIPKWGETWEQDVLPVIEDLVAAIENMWVVIGPIFDLVFDATKLMGTVFSENVQLIANLISGDFSGAWENAKNIITAFRDFFSDKIEEVKGYVEDLGPKLKTLAEDAFNDLQDGVSTVWNTRIEPWMKGLPDKILEAIGDLGDLLLEVGKALMQGLADGITWGYDHTVKPVLDFVTDMIPLDKGPMEKDKTLLKPSGIAIMGGLAIGFREGYDYVVKPELQAITEDLVKAWEGMPLPGRADIIAAAGAGKAFGGGSGAAISGGRQSNYDWNGFWSSAGGQAVSDALNDQSAIRTRMLTSGGFGVNWGDSGGQVTANPSYSYDDLGRNFRAGFGGGIDPETGQYIPPSGDININIDTVVATNEEEAAQAAGDIGFNLRALGLA